MFKLKPILLSTFPRMRMNLNQLYSKTAEKLEPALSLADALGANKETTSKTVPNPSIDSNILSVDNSPPAVAKAGDKGGKECKGAAKKGDTKSKKGKKCGQSKPTPPKKPGPPGGGYTEDICDMLDTPKPNAKKWRTLSYALVPFALGLSAFVLATKEEQPELDYIPYEHLYRRTKRFAWGDGTKSLFHGPHNYIPQVEEERLDREAEENGDSPGPRYKKRVDEMEEKKKRREQHAQEELERRKNRHEEEAAKKEAAQ